MEIVFFAHPSPKEKAEKEHAWAQKYDEEKLVSYLKKGSTAVLSAVSHRNTVTKDTFMLTGFSDAQFTIVDIFGQGNKMVKHWNFKGTHDGDFFGVPATGKSVDISGTTLIKMKDGKIASEQDYMDFLSFYTQLGLLGQ